MKPLLAVIALSLASLAEAQSIASLGEHPIAFRQLRAVFPETSVAIESRTDCRLLKVLLANNDRQRARGLMFVNDMPADAGMLFVYERSRPLSMWMKNTLIPLDMLFAAEDGVIVTLLSDVPPLTLESRRSERDATYVLELNAGAAARLGLAEGARLHVAPD
ncbi:MAG: DUF192 domain-containing protein [Pseudomonadota bacterium]